jgi:hypothetical protein
MLNTIAKPFGLLMLWFYNITGNYGLAIIFFALVVNLILLPFMMKSKRGMMRQMRLQPKIAELQKRHEGNQQKLNEEMSRLYREEKVNRCPVHLEPDPVPDPHRALSGIRLSITTMMGVPSDLLAEGGSIYQKLIDLGYSLSNYTTITRSATSRSISQSSSPSTSRFFRAFGQAPADLVQVPRTGPLRDPQYKIWDSIFRRPPCGCRHSACSLFRLPRRSCPGSP